MCVRSREWLTVHTVYGQALPSNFVLVNFQAHVASHVARLFGVLNKKSTKILWLCSSMVEFQSMIFVMGQTLVEKLGIAGSSPAMGDAGSSPVAVTPSFGLI